MGLLLVVIAVNFPYQLFKLEGLLALVVLEEGVEVDLEDLVDPKPVSREVEELSKELVSLLQCEVLEKRNVCGLPALQFHSVENVESNEVLFQVPEVFVIQSQEVSLGAVESLQNAQKALCVKAWQAR